MQRGNAVKLTLWQAYVKIQPQGAADALLPELAHAHPGKLKHQDIHQRAEGLRVVAVLRREPGGGAAFNSGAAGIELLQGGWLGQCRQPALVRKQLTHRAARRRKRRPDIPHLQLRAAAAIMQRQQQAERRGRLGRRKDRHERIRSPPIARAQGEEFLPMLPDGDRSPAHESLAETALKLPCPFIIHTA